MPMRNLNDMDQHDGTQQKVSFGGPYHVRIALNGDELYRGEVGKAHDLYISYAPLGETEEAPADD